MAWRVNAILFPLPLLATDSPFCLLTCCLCSDLLASVAEAFRGLPEPNPYFSFFVTFPKFFFLFWQKLSLEEFALKINGTLLLPQLYLQMWQNIGQLYVESCSNQLYLHPTTTTDNRAQGNYQMQYLSSVCTIPYTGLFHQFQYLRTVQNDSSFTPWAPGCRTGSPLKLFISFFCLDVIDMLIYPSYIGKRKRDVDR